MNMQLFFDYFSHFTTILILVNVVIGLYYYKYYTSALKVIVIYLIGVAFIDIVISSLIEFGGNKDFRFLIAFLKMFSRVFDFLSLSYLLAVAILQHKKMFGILLMLSSYFIIEGFFFTPDNERNYVSYATIFSYVIMCILSLYSLISLIKAEQINMKYVGLVAILLYYDTIMIVFFIIENFVVNQHYKPTTIYLYLAYVMSVFLFHIALNIQLWRNGKIQKRSLAG